MYTLEMSNIVKDYHGNRVLKGVDLKVGKGEIHALLGENGAGKSTLMNILFGMPVIHSTGGFEGEVKIEGEVLTAKTPEEAIASGIGMVHQEFMLIPEFTITENIKLNREISNSNPVSAISGKKSLEWLDYKKMNKDARAALDNLGMDIPETMKVKGMPVGYMQFIEIAREIDKENVKLLVFDEPTAVLTESEADNLIASMKRLADKGISILFITHRLNEVMNAADNVTILRDGELVVSKAVKDTSVVELAELMVGRKIEITSREVADHENMEVAMTVRDLHVDMPGEEVKGIDLDIYKGEILGIGGLAGQGKIGVANGIMGLYETRGAVTLAGEELPLNAPAKVLEKRLAFVSEDRRGIGLLLDTSIKDNIIATAAQVQKKFLKKYGFFTLKDEAKIENHAQKMIEELDIRCTGSHQLTRRLSGGNQQKVCIARALTLEPEVLFVSEPTRGIDIGAKKIVLDMLVKLNKEKGTTIVVTSSELGELRSVSDRIAIVTEGKLEGILSPDAPDADYGLMMSGDYRKIRGGGY